MHSGQCLPIKCRTLLLSAASKLPQRLRTPTNETAVSVLAVLCQILYGTVVVVTLSTLFVSYRLSVSGRRALPISLKIACNFSIVTDNIAVDSIVFCLLFV